MRRRDAWDLITSVSGNAGIQAIGILTAILAARLYAPADRGELAAAVTWSLVFVAMTDLGLSQAVPFFAAKQTPNVGSTSVAIALLATVAVTPVAALLVMVWGPESSRVASAYALLIVPFALILNYCGGLVQGQSRHRSFTVMRTLAAIPYALGLILAGWWWRSGPDAVLLVALGLTISLSVAIVTYSSRTIDAFGRPSRSLSRPMIAFGVRTYPGNLAWIGNQRAPMLIVGAVLGSASLGVYSVAQSYAAIPFVVASAIALLIPGRVASVDGSEAKRESLRFIVLGSIATWVVAAALIPLAGTIVPLVYGSVYDEAVIPSVVLLLASGFVGFNFVVSTSLRSVGKPSAPSQAEAIGLILTLILAAILVRTIGAIGAAWATLGSSVVVAFILSFKFMRHYGESQ